MKFSPTIFTLIDCAFWHGQSDIFPAQIVVSEPRDVFLNGRECVGKLEHHGGPKGDLRHKIVHALRRKATVNGLNIGTAIVGGEPLMVMAKCVASSYR